MTAYEDLMNIIDHLNEDQINYVIILLKKLFGIIL